MTVPEQMLVNPRYSERIEAALNAKLDRPWCLHRLCDEVVRPIAPEGDANLLEVTKRAADELSRSGRARNEPVSALMIGVHCEDWVYWSAFSKKSKLSEFGPEYESPAILYRLASHFQCHGL
ncbi:MAG: hypothetical protein L3K08_01225 [Thermoplasmata archaeon]|jgi:hypothetical protein|nr:hypothetical protein [Thermoplasmata archaeon]